MFVGIDIGHTTVTAVAFDDAWTVAGEVGIDAGMERPSDDRAEIPVEHRWDVTMQCLDELESAIRPYDRIEGIGLAGGGDGLYPLDGDEKPLMAGVTLLDERASEVYERWQRDGTYREICEILGTPSPPGASIVVLRWLKENDPETYGAIEHLLNLKDAVRFKLTGELALEISDATFSYTNHRTQDYDPELFELAGVAEKTEALPELKAASHEVAGHTTPAVERETGIDAGTPVVAGAHDACANTLGVGAIQEGVVNTTGGTWSFSTAVGDEPSVRLDRWCCENFVERGLWMFQIATPTGAISLNWFVDEFCDPERRTAEREGLAVWDVIESKIADVDTDVLFHPFMFGNPYGHLYADGASGTFTGLGPTDGRPEMLRAVYEAIAFVHRWQIDLLDDAFGVDEVRFTGGAAKSDFWAQMFADVMRVPVTTTTIEESGCFGAAMLAAIGTGELSGVEATADLVEVDTVYTPTDTDYTDKYEKFRRLTDTLEDTWAVHNDGP